MCTDTLEPDDKGQAQQLQSSSPRQEGPSLYMDCSNMDEADSSHRSLQRLWRKTGRLIELVEEVRVGGWGGGTGWGWDGWGRLVATVPESKGLGDGYLGSPLGLKRSK